MKHYQLSDFSFGAATGIFAWILSEILVFTLFPTFSNKLTFLFIGGLSGLVLGGFFWAREDFFDKDNSKILKNAVNGGLLGCIIGFISALFIILLKETVIREFVSTQNILFTSLQWMLFASVFSIIYNHRNEIPKDYKLIIFSGIATGVTIAIITIIVDFIQQPPLIQHCLDFIIFGIIFIPLQKLSSGVRKLESIKSLNGQLMGIKYELTKEIYYLGTQPSDDIDLSNYDQINSTHAKLVKRTEGYSLVDNDPACKTFVNFRNISEQSLKNGDILKLGTALFQFCTKTGDKKTP